LFWPAGADATSSRADRAFGAGGEPVELAPVADVIPAAPHNVADALAASSLGRRGIVAGDAADLVVVGEDPSRVTPAGLRTMPVLGTLLQGRWTYRDPVLEA